MTPGPGTVTVTVTVAANLGRRGASAWQAATGSGHGLAFWQRGPLGHLPPRWQARPRGPYHNMLVACVVVVAEHPRPCALPGRARAL